MASEVISLLIAIAGGFVSGFIFRVLPGKIRLRILLDGKSLSETSKEAEFKTKIVGISIPASIIVSIIFLIATIYGTWIYLSNLTVFKGYIFLINTIVAISLFVVGLSFSLLNKLALDFDITKEAYRAFIRKVTLATIRRQEE